MFTIITPCSRPENLDTLLESIDLDKIQWLIVHDTAKRPFIQRYSHPKITEIGHPTPPGGRAGHAQRNAGIKLLNDGLIYFLDDDTIIHPSFWKIFPIFDQSHFYTFDQQRWDEFVSEPGGTFRGNEPKLMKMDSAQYVVPIRMCGSFIESDYRADGVFIEEVNTKHPDAHVYIPIVACYYNYLRK